MPPDESVTIRIALRDAISAGLVKIDAEAKNTGKSLKNMGDDGTKSLRRQNAEASKSEKGLRGLRLKAMDLGFLWKTMKIPLFATAFNLAIPAVGALAAQVMSLTSSLGPSVGLLAGFPAAIGGILSVVGVVKLATSGVGALVKAMTKQGATQKEVDAAMKGQSKTVIEFAKSIAAMQKKVKPIKEAAQAALLPAFTRALQRTIPLVNMAKGAIGGLATVVAGLVDDASKMLTSGPWTKDFQLFLARNNIMLKLLGGALLSVANAGRNVVMSAGPMVLKFAELIRRGAAWVAIATDAGRQSGRLEGFFSRTYTTLTRLARTLSNFGIGLFNVFRGGTRMGDNMWASLEKISVQFRAWTSSDKGRATILHWFESMRPIIEAMGRLVTSLTTAFGKLNATAQTPGSGLAETLDGINTKLIPALTSLIGGVGSSLGPAIVDIATAFVKIADFASFSPLITTIQWIAKLLDLFTKFSESDNKTSSSAHHIATQFVGLALAVRGLGSALAVAKLASKFGGLNKVAGSINPRQAGGLTSLIRGMRAGPNVMKKGGELVDDTSFAARAGGLVRRAGSAVRGAPAAMMEKGRAAAVRLAAAYDIVSSKIGALASKGWDLAKSLAGTVKQLVLQAGQLVKNAALWVWAKVQVAAQAVAEWAVTAATAAWTAATWLLDGAMAVLTSPITLAVAAIALLVIGIYEAYKHSAAFRGIVEAVWQALQVAWDWITKVGVAAWDLAQKVWDLFLKFSPLGILLNEITTHFSGIVGAVRDLVTWIGNAIGAIGNFDSAMSKSKLGKYAMFAANPVGGVINAVTGGDTNRPRAAGGNLRSTFAQHAAISGRTPGKQTVTNVLYGKYAGSDHLHGRALDLVGSNLNTYGAQVRAGGGYAAMHGSGEGRHLHAAFGDTTRPRAGRGGGEAVVLQLDGPLVGQVIANTDIDVSRAVKKGIQDWIREREERK